MWLPGLVANGSVPISLVDTAVSRLYTTHFMLGLADDPATIPYAQLPPSTVDSFEHRALSLEAARASIVLLKNAAGTLPLSANARVALIGPHANATEAFLSSYHGDNTLVYSHSPLMVAQRRGLHVTYSLGCNICDIRPPGYPNEPCPPGRANDTSHIAAAAAAAAAADVAVVFIGADQTTEAENFDRDGIALVGQQEALLRAVVAVQPRTVVVLISGGIISSPFVMNASSAILYAFYGEPAVMRPAHVDDRGTRPPPAPTVRRVRPPRPPSRRRPVGRRRHHRCVDGRRQPRRGVARHDVLPQLHGA